MRTLRTFLLGAVSVGFMLALVRGIGAFFLMNVVFNDSFWLPGTAPFGEAVVGIIVIGLLATCIWSCYTIARAIFWIGEFMEKQWRDLRTRK